MVDFARVGMLHGPLIEVLYALECGLPVPLILEVVKVDGPASLSFDSDGVSCAPDATWCIFPPNLLVAEKLPELLTNFAGECV